MKKVSFIILSFNSSELTLRCVQSVVQHIPTAMREVIVVDNGSRQQEVQALADSSLAAHFILVKSRLNTGFGAGNMQGANIATGQYLCFLNNDVVLNNDCVSPLCQYLEQHPDVGSITPVQLNMQGQQTRMFKHNQGIRHELLGDSLFERFFPHRYPKRDALIEGAPKEVMQINGCFMLFPTDKFWAIGGFDTNIFLYHEEYDLAIRQQQHGWKRVIFPDCSFVHAHGATMSKIPGKTVIRELYISKIYTYRKYHGLILSILFQTIIIAGLLFKPGKWYLLKVAVRGEALSRSMRHTIVESGNTQQTTV